MEMSLLTAHPRLVEGPWWAMWTSEQQEFMLRLELHLLHAGGPLLTRSHLFLDSWAAPLPFYKGAMLVSSRVEGPDGSVGVLDVLLAHGVIFCLSGASELIHAFNGGELQTLPTASATVSRLLGQPHGSPLTRLDEPEIGMAYLRFFSGAVRGDSGGFHIVESAEHLSRLGVVDKRGGLAARVGPMRWRVPAAAGADGQQGWLVQTYVVYSGHLFEAHYRLLPSGEVRMEDDTTLATDICPAEIHSGLLRSILPADGPVHHRNRRQGRRAPGAKAAQPPWPGTPEPVSVPAYRALPANDTFLAHLRCAAEMEIVAPGGQDS